MDYKSERWRRLRQCALARDGWRCRECSRYGVSREASVVHHVQPVEDAPELQWKIGNLISLCPTCHNAMHSRNGRDLSDRGRDWLRRTPPPPPKAPLRAFRRTGEGRMSSDAAANGPGVFRPRRY